MEGWQSLKIEDKELIDSYTKNRFVICNYSFINLFIWSSEDNIKYLIENEILYLKSEIKGTEYYYMPIPKDFSLEKIKVGINKILEKNGIINLVPEEIKNKLEENYNMEEDLDNADYIYLVEDLAFLKGRRYSKKKNKINQFNKNDYTYEQITENNVDEVIKYQHEWCEVKECNENKNLRIENFGIIEILKNFKNLDIKGGIIKIDNKIVAYTIAEKLTDEIIIIHTEKANEAINGSYQKINSLFLEKECLEFKYVNREDDAGIEGLRQAKESYFPITKYKKFKIISTKIN